MTPVYQIEVDQGATYTLETIYKTAAGELVPLAGYSGRGSAKVSAQDSVEVFALTVTVDESTSKVTISVPASISEGVTLTGKDYTEKTRFVFDVELFTAGDADVIRYMQGPLIMSPGITKKAS